VSRNSSRIARIVAVAGTALALAAAPVAAADPSDLMPLCTGNQSPAQDNCKTPCPEGAAITALGACGEPGTTAVSGGPEDYVGTGSTGADPAVPVGTDPNEVAYPNA
jgi:hypothetical protein